MLDSSFLIAALYMEFALNIELTALRRKPSPVRLDLAIFILLFGFGCSAVTSAADVSKSPAGVTALPGLVSPPGNLDQESKPGDVEAQLREIENTKKLMKALGELHGQGTGGPQSQSPAQAGADAAKSAAGGAAVLLAPGSRDPKGLELPGLPTEDLRALGKEASQAARAVGLDSGSAGAVASSGQAAANPGENGGMRPPRASAPGDEERYKVMLESLLEEIGPWVIAFVVIFFLGYVTISWISARARKTSRMGDRGRSGSRRKGGSGRRSGSGSRNPRRESIDRVPQSARNGG